MCNPDASQSIVASNANVCYIQTVNIVKIFVKNSLCGYRESKKSDKYVISWSQELMTQRSVSSLSKCSTSIMWKCAQPKMIPPTKSFWNC